MRLGNACCTVHSSCFWFIAKAHKKPCEIWRVYNKGHNDDSPQREYLQCLSPIGAVLNFKFKVHAICSRYPLFTLDLTLIRHIHCKPEMLLQLLKIKNNLQWCNCDPKASKSRKKGQENHESGSRWYLKGNFRICKGIWLFMLTCLYTISQWGLLGNISYKVWGCSIFRRKTNFAFIRGPSLSEATAVKHWKTCLPEISFSESWILAVRIM